MRSPLSSTACLVALSAMALAGCASTGTKEAAKPAVRVAFSSPAIKRGGKIPARYTCDGHGGVPPFTWGKIGVPTSELALFVISLAKPKANEIEETVEWAMAGISPSRHKLAAGEIPKGAFLVQAENGKKNFSICPAKGKTAQYSFALFAIPQNVRVAPTLPAPELLYNLTKSKPQFRAPAAGQFLASYKRP